MKQLFFYITILIVLNTQAQNTYTDSIQKHRTELNEHFKNAKTSPLPSKKRKEFTALPFFKIDPKLKVKAKLKYTFNSPIQYIKNTKNKTEAYQKYALATFVVNNKTYSLSIYQSLSLKKVRGYENYLFIPFTDLSNGKTTYHGGRYLDSEIPKDASGYIILDFNKAYNPYCAYNKNYACPIPPKNNYIATEILAGVKYKAI